MKGQIAGVTFLVLLLFIAGCSNQKEVQTSSGMKKTGTFTVSELGCCPPSVVEDIIEKLDGVSKAVVKDSGSKWEATVSFDDKKTNIEAIKKAVSDVGIQTQ